MDEDLRRLAGIILRAPLSRRTVREFIYCGFGTVTGFFGFWITVVLLASGMIVSASIVGTVVGLMVIVLALRVTRRLGALHRRLVGWLLREGLLDQLDLLVFPVVLGTGKRLFSEPGSQVPLALTGSQAFSTGVVHLSYEPADGAAKTE